MRRTFATALEDLAAIDPRVVLITGDLGFGVLESFARRFPNRFFNAGVAEQNMVGVATGMAEGGFVPFLYSIATFAAMRPFEFIRNGPALHGLPVRVVGTGCGIDYGLNGVSHYALEDIALFRSLPGVVVIAPADAGQTRSAVWSTQCCTGPIYFRLSKDEGPPVPGLNGAFALGRLEVIRWGGEVALLAMGDMASHAASAAAMLASQGVATTVAVIACLAPAPVDDLCALLSSARVAIVVESHSIVGGLGSLVAEIAAEHALQCRVVRCGITRIPDVVGTPQYLHEQLGSSAAAIAACVVDVRRGIA